MFRFLVKSYYSFSIIIILLLRASGRRRAFSKCLNCARGKEEMWGGGRGGCGVVWDLPSSFAKPTERGGGEIRHLRQCGRRRRVEGKQSLSLFS